MRRRLLLALIVLVAALGAVALAGCGGDGDDEEAAPAATEEATTEAATTEEAETEDGGGEAGGAEAGAQVYAEAGCGSCHTLEAAGSTGSVGPNLDDLQPSQEQVVEQVTNGGGGMPAFADQLSEQQIQDVAAYVVESTQG